MNRKELYVQYSIFFFFSVGFFLCYKYCYKYWLLEKKIISSLLHKVGRSTEGWFCTSFKLSRTPWSSLNIESMWCAVGWKKSDLLPLKKNNKGQQFTIYWLVFEINRLHPGNLYSLPFYCCWARVRARVSVRFQRIMWAYGEPRQKKLTVYIVLLKWRLPSETKRFVKSVEGIDYVLVCT